MQDSEKFVRNHKTINVPINSQIIDAPDFEQRVTRAVPECVGCITTRVTAASPHPHVLTDDSRCIARLVVHNTAEAVIQTGQYFMGHVYANIDGSRPHNRPDLASRSEM